MSHEFTTGGQYTIRTSANQKFIWTLSWKHSQFTIYWITVTDEKVSFKTVGENALQWLITLCLKCQKIVKNARHYFMASQVTSSNVFFCLTNSPKPIISDLLSHMTKKIIKFAHLTSWKRKRLPFLLKKQIKWLIDQNSRTTTWLIT